MCRLVHVGSGKESQEGELTKGVDLVVVDVKNARLLSQLAHYFDATHRTDLASKELLLGGAITGSVVGGSSLIENRKVEEAESGKHFWGCMCWYNTSTEKAN